MRDEKMKKMLKVCGKGIASFLVYMAVAGPVGTTGTPLI